MLLDYSKFHNLDIFGRPTINSDVVDILDKYEAIDVAKAGYALSEINKRVGKANKKQEEIDNLIYEKELIIGDVINLIREDISQSYYNIFSFVRIRNLLWEAWDYFWLKKEGETEKEHLKGPEGSISLEDFEKSYNVVIGTVKDKLIPEKYRDESILVEIMDWNLSTAYEFTFKYKDIEFIIGVPMFKNANNKNYLEMLSGYTLKFREDECSLGFGFSTLNPKEFKGKLESWIDERLKTDQKE